MTLEPLHIQVTSDFKYKVDIPVCINPIITIMLLLQNILCLSSPSCPWKTQWLLKCGVLWCYSDISLCWESAVLPWGWDALPPWLCVDRTPYSSICERVVYPERIRQHNIWWNLSWRTNPLPEFIACLEVIRAWDNMLDRDMWERCCIYMVKTNDFVLCSLYCIHLTDLWCRKRILLNP